jgi:hypothetical protein
MSSGMSAPLVESCHHGHYAAQRKFGRGRRFDRIDLRLRDGISLDDGRAGFSLRSDQALKLNRLRRGRHLESLLQTYSLGTSISSLFALIIGMFIIYNSFSIAIAAPSGDRHPSCLGATRSWSPVVPVGEPDCRFVGFCMVLVGMDWLPVLRATSGR